jgi:hypothetical protein
LTLDVASPFHGVFPLGVADANGDVSLSVAIPASIPPGSLPDDTFTLQAVSADVVLIAGPPSITFCTSNTATIAVGAG